MSDYQQRDYGRVLAWLKTTTELSDARLARLLGVSRQSIHLWKAGKPMRAEHFRRLLRVAEIVKRAASRQDTPLTIRAWLDMPWPPDGRTPAGLLEAGDFDKARYCAVATWMVL